MSVRSARYSTAFQRYRKGTSYSPIERDAWAFIEAAQLTSSLHQEAIVTLVRDLKKAQLWGKMKAVYPFIGGTASSHKWNLINPQDTDAAFRLQFNGGWTHSSTGALPNGTNGWANTFLPANTTAQNSTHISAYSRTNRGSQTGNIICVSYSGGTTNIYVNYLNNIYSVVNDSGGAYATQAITDSRAYIIANRTDSTSHKQYRNNGSAVTKSSNSTAPTTATYDLGRGVFGGVSYWDNTEMAFITIGDGLTDSEASTLNFIVKKYQRILGRSVTAFDDDAQAFVTAAGITDSTQINAVDQLVQDLKGFNLWSKMKAVYPFVGGTAATHKFNLKDPQDTNAAGRLTFSGGWTHDANGITGNGSNTVANTNRAPSHYITENSSHLSIYSRTNNTGSYYDINSYQTGASQAHDIFIRNASNGAEMLSYQWPQNNLSLTITDSSGLFVNSRASASSHKAFRNATVIASSTAAPVGYSLLVQNYCIGANAQGTTAFTNRNYAFATIGDGLTDTDATNFYAAVHRFQRLLGRGVTALDNDAQAFVAAAGLTGSTQIAAVDLLVQELKACNLWTKMKAVYPFVGGTATTHKWNLKDPQDTDAAFRLTFSGGWTHSSTGALPNGTNGYADTFFSPLNDYTSQNTGNYGVYLRTNNTTAGVDIGNWTTSAGYNYLYTYISGALRDFRLNDNENVLRISNVTRTDGLFTASRRSSSDIEGYRNGVSEGTASHGTNTRQNITMTISALKGFGSPAGLYSNREVAFAHIGGDGLTDTNASDLYNIVQRFQTTLGRQV